MLVSIGTVATAEQFAHGSASYSPLKPAVTNWTLGQAQVVSAKDVRCNLVSPGPIFFEGGNWERVKQQMARFYAATENAHPARRLGTGREVGDAVAFLVSDCARHINGVNLTVDAGFSKRMDL